MDVCKDAFYIKEIVVVAVVVVVDDVCYRISDKP